MNKELIERMKKNEKPFGLLNCKEQRLLCSIGREFCQYYAAKGFPWLELNRGDNQFDETLTYRIRPDYAPEPEVIRCEVMLQNNNVVYIIESQRAGILLYKALGNKNYIESEWADGTRDCNIRRYKGNGQSAEYPVAVLFAEETK